MSEKHSKFSRREREMIDILFALGEATSAQIREKMENPPTGNAVRATLQILEDKGAIFRDRKEGREFVFKPRKTPAAQAFGH